MESVATLRMFSDDTRMRGLLRGAEKSTLGCRRAGDHSSFDLIRLREAWELVPRVQCQNLGSAHGESF